eukprot:jgi/Bigna1/134870/aug1.27_g9578
MGWLSWFSSNCPLGLGCCFVPRAPEGTVLPHLEEVQLGGGDGGGESVILEAGMTAKENDSKGGHAAAAVRVVLISDTHGRHRELDPLPKGDVLIHAGDFTTYHKYGSRGTLQEFDRWLGEQTQYTTRLVICGNHETFLDEGGDSRPSCELKNAQWLHGNIIETTSNLRVYGAPYRPRRGCCYQAEAFGRSQGFLRDVWKSIKKEARIDIVVTHGPPFGVLDVEKVGHIGDWYLLKHIQEARPSLHVFGHVHGTHGARLLRNKNTVSMNPNSSRSHNKSGDNTILFVNASSCCTEKGGLHPPVIVDIFPKV